MARMRAAAARAGADRRRRGVRLPRRARPAGAARDPAAVRPGVGCSGCYRSRGGCGGATCVTTRASSWAFARQYAVAHRAAAADERARRPGAGARLAPCCAAPARADVFDDNPATASRGPGDAWIFARAADGATLERHWTAAAWTDWASLGGNATSGPAAVGYGEHGPRVRPRHRRRDLPELAHAAAHWSGWASLGGYATSAPAAPCAAGRNYVDLAVKGGDNAIYLRTLSCPARLVALGLARRQPDLGAGAELAVRRVAQRLGARHRRRASSSRPGTARRGATGWTSAAGIIGAPAAVSRAENVVNVYVRGAGNAVYQRCVDRGGGWSAWFLLDARAVDSSPAAGGDGPTTSGWSRAAAADLLFKEWNGSAGWAAVDATSARWPSRRRRRPAPPPPRRPTARSSSRPACAARRPAAALRVSVTIRKPTRQAQARACRRSSSSPRARAARCASTARRRSSCGSGSTARPGRTGRVYARVYYRRSAQGQAAPQDGLPPLHGLPLASLARMPYDVCVIGLGRIGLPLAPQLRRLGPLRARRRQATPSAWPRSASGGCRSRSPAPTS